MYERMEDRKTFRIVPEGEWIIKARYGTDKNGNFKTWYYSVCSVCGRNPKMKYNRQAPFCPNCGSRMKKTINPFSKTNNEDHAKQSEEK